VGGDLVQERGEGALFGGAEAEAVQGGRAMADEGGQKAAGQGHGDGASGLPRRHRGEHHVGAWRPLGPEAAADVFGHHGDPILGKPEQRGQYGSYDRGALAGVVHDETAVDPAGGGRVWLHGVVVQRRHPVVGVDTDRGGREDALGVAAFPVPGVPAVGLLGDVRTGMAGRERHVVVLRVVLDTHCRGAGPCCFQGFGDDQGDRPATVRHTGVLQDCERGIVGVGEPGSVLVGEYGEGPGQPQRVGAVDRADRTTGDRGGHGPCVHPAGDGVFGRVTGQAGDLLPALSAFRGRAHRGIGVGHGVLLVVPGGAKPCQVPVVGGASRVRTSRARLRARRTL
jgi:hypothetical protein